MNSDRISDDDKKALLARILESDALKRSDQLRRLFSWLGEASLSSKEAPTEYEVGVGPLKRSKDFDPQTDSLVRREMNRLRQKLDLYYATEGRSELLRLDCHGGYRIRFRSTGGDPGMRQKGVPRLLILPMRATEDFSGWAADLFDELFLAVVSSESHQLVAQTTCLQYAGRSGDIRDFAAETGAELVVEGRIRPSESEKAIAALWLVDGASGIIRGQCLLPIESASLAGQHAAKWLSQRPEAITASPIPEPSLESNVDSGPGA